MERRADEAMAAVRACAPCCAGMRSDRAALAALVATLEGALRATRDLLDALDAASYAMSAKRPPMLRNPCYGACPGSPTAPDHLSPREREVLHLLVAGQSNRRIAQALFLSPRTVQRHVANAYLKIGAHSRAEATAYVLQHGLA